VFKLLLLLLQGSSKSESELSHAVAPSKFRLLFSFALHRSEEFFDVVG